MVLLAFASGCSGDENRLFQRLDSGQTGVDFANTITPDDSLMNPIDFFYVYNGGGVAVGDVNQDGRSDLYFTGNAVENRLYLNQGNLQFTDVTGQAGVAAGEAWSTGVALVDINQDGLQDIYVCVGGPPEVTEGRSNRLYVNQGLDADSIPTFKEAADAYGIADSGYSTQAAFFDYDRDGDLDLYVLNTAGVSNQMSSVRSASSRQTPPSGQQAPSTDRLYRNDGAPEGPSEEPPTLLKSPRMLASVTKDTG